MKATMCLQQVRESVGVFTRDVGHGLLEVSHNTLALVGLAVVAALIFLGGKAELRHSAEDFVLGWLTDRMEQRAERDGNLLAALRDPAAVGRATALDPRSLDKQEAAVASWLSRRYRVAPEPVARIVREAWALAPRAQVDPALILAVVAVESSFNPFAQSPVGAQGLMQVMTKVHNEKYSAFGGVHAAFDPVSNLKVGVQVLKDCIARFGGVQEGLRCYVGAANQEDDGNYAGRVMAEHGFLKQVAEGKAVPVNATAPSVLAQAAASQAIALR